MNIIYKNTEQDISGTPTKIFIINSLLSLIILLIVVSSLFFLRYPETFHSKVVLIKYQPVTGNAIFTGKMNIPPIPGTQLKKGMTVKISYEDAPVNASGYLEGKIMALDTNPDHSFTATINIPSKKLIALLKKNSIEDYSIAKGEVYIRDLRLYQKIFSYKSTD